MIQFPKINGHYRSANGTFSLPEKLCAQYGDFDRWCTEVFCQRCGLVPGAGNPWLILKRDSALPPEGYRLRVTAQQIEVTAATEAGIVYALTTLYLREDQAAVEPDLKVMFDYVTRFFRLSDLTALYRLYFR